MFRKVEDFLGGYSHSSQEMVKLMSALTDESLSQEVAPGHRNLGRIAWHIAQAIPEMCARTGLNVAGPAESDPVPSSAKAIVDAYESAANSLLSEVKAKWDDSTLEVIDDMYGMQWARGLTLAILMEHDTLHAGQMTVLMRQAGLPVHGICGPSKDEWGEYGMDAPAI
jgi:uncharacterized damage-inducible protein DinB